MYDVGRDYNFPVENSPLFSPFYLFDCSISYFSGAVVQMIVMCSQSIPNVDGIRHVHVDTVHVTVLCKLDYSYVLYKVYTVCPPVHYF